MAKKQFLDVFGVKFLWENIKSKFAYKAEVPTKMSELLNDVGYRTTDQRGEAGPYYKPSVDNNGNLSWTNNGGLDNPRTVNIKGPKGDNATGGYETAQIFGYATNPVITLKPQETNYITISLDANVRLGKLLKAIINNNTNIEPISIINVDAIMDPNGQLSNGTIRLNICNPTSEEIVVPANASYLLTYGKGLAVGTLDALQTHLGECLEHIQNIVWITEDEYNELVENQEVNPDVTYNIYEEDE